MMLFRCLIAESVCLQSQDCLTVKAVKASKSWTLLWYAKKEKYLHRINIFTFTKIFPPSLT